MSVYVDTMRAKYGRMIMCHMVADSLDELHAMAERIGVDRRWFQSKASFPHYDICLSSKRLAMANGAVLVDRREMVRLAIRLATNSGSRVSRSSRRSRGS